MAMDSAAGGPTLACVRLAAVVTMLLALFTIAPAASLSAHQNHPSSNSSLPSRRGLPRPNPVYTAAELDLLRAHFHRFMHLKAAEPLVHVLPESGVLFQIVAPAPPHLGRYCGRGGGDDGEKGAVEAAVDVVDMFGQRAPRALGSDGDGLFILETDGNRRLYEAEVAVLRRIPEGEVWRVYYPSSARVRSNGGLKADDVTHEVLTEVIAMQKVWANRMPRANCRAALAAELGYDPYARDALRKQEHPGLGVGLQAYTYPLPEDSEAEGSSA